MAKKQESTETVTIEVTPDEIANALEGISEWALSLRKAVLLFPNMKARVKKKVSNENVPPPWLDGCPPPDPCKKPPHKPRKRG